MRLMMTIMASLLLLLLHLHPLSSSAFTPNPSYFLNCGSSTTATLPGDNPTRHFVPDSTYLTSTSTSTSTSQPLSPTSTSALYSSARLFTSPTSYKFPTDLPSTYILRLHFLPSHNLSSSSNFSVSALSRFSLLSHFSPPPFPSSTPLIKEFLLPLDSPSPFTLTFTPFPLAFINAIELFAAPSNLVDSSAPRYITPKQNPLSPPSQGLELLYRVNVGGPLITPTNDTLWRTWVPDDPFMFNPALSFKNYTDAAIRYGPQMTPEIAPESVYDTARTMAVTPDMQVGNPFFSFNLTWSFPVSSPEKTHFIRLHFCNFLFSPPSELYFNVYIGDHTAYLDLQPSSFTAQFPAAAFYVDFAADSDGSGLVNVSVGRSNMSTPTSANAILNGVEIMRLGLDSASAARGDHGVSMRVLIPSVLAGAALLLLSSLIIIFVCRKRQRSWKVTATEPKPSPSWSPYTPPPVAANSVCSPSTEFLTTLHIPFDEIRLATDNFDEQLVIGSGGFGKVYRGVLRDGTKIAVKRGIPGSRQGYPEFQTEIEVLSRIRHRHLVSLIGYCEDQSEMILVYEYMDRGPLKDHLYGSGNLPCLSWKQRLSICIGAARGLHYLHTGYSHNIIHRDIKSTNILLAEDYLAKVADFGLSRIGPAVGETHVSTGVKGTFGYLDPEYFKVQKLTDKSDVYSFGVMMFEVLCARPVIDPNLRRDQLNLAEWAVMWQRRGELERIADPRLKGEINLNSLRKFGETAEKCLAEYGENRPTIGDVLWNLEYALQLQETEVRREPFEDSGNVEDAIPVNAVVRAVSSSSMMEEEERRSEVSESMVFSQLITDDGR